MTRFRYQFPYKKIRTPSLTKILPVIPVEVSCEERAVTYEALIDSGAGLCIFDAALAEVLGVDLKSGKEIQFGGVTGAPGVGYLHAVYLKVRGNRYRTSCIFTEDIPDYGYGILGHLGFFDHYRVKLEYDIGRIELTPVARR